MLKYKDFTKLTQMQKFYPVLHYNLLNNTVYDYLVALGILVGLLILFRVFEKVIIHNFEKLARRTTTDIDDELVRIIKKIPNRFYNFVAFYIAIRSLILPSIVLRSLNIFMIILLVYVGTRVVVELLNYILFKADPERENIHEEQSITFYAFSMVFKILLWFTAGILILSNLGVDVSALVAGLGIGGIAIALASQNIIADILSSFSIYFDKPFEIGDFIVLGEDRGWVKKIGLKTTRIESIDGEEIIIANRELTGSRVQNFRRLKKRRIRFTIGVVYGTTYKKLKTIPGLIKEVFKKIETAELERVHFVKFDDYSLNFEIAYLTESPTYSAYLDVNQEIQYGIKKAFEEAKLEIAFPTRTIHIEK